MPDLTPEAGPAVPPPGGTVPVPLPTQPLSATQTVTVTDPTPPATGRRRTALLAGLVALVLVGGTAAVAMSRLRPQGAQPDTVVPASAVAYLRLDLDPSVGQKLSAVRFFQKLPSSAGDVAKDPRQALFDLIKKRMSDPADLDYVRDVESWLGNRVALAVLPGSGDSPLAYVALEVTDEAKARAGIDKILAKAGDQNSSDITLRGGYALMCEKGKAGELTAALDKGTIASNSTYTSDMEALGDQGVFSMWVDAGKAAEMATSLGLPMSDTTSQTADSAPLDVFTKGMRVAAAIRFDPDYVELAGVTRGDAVKDLPSGGATGLMRMSELPDDTMVALQVNGAGDAFTSSWASLATSLDKSGVTTVSDLENGLGMRLPEDMANILGSTLTVALADQDISSGSPTVGIVTTPKDVAEAERTLQALLGNLGDLGASTFAVSTEGDKLVVASSQEYSAQLKATGALGSDAGFTKAVPSADKARAGFYVNLDRLEKQYADSVPADWKDFVLALKAIGMSASSDSDGGSFAVRLTGD